MPTNYSGRFTLIALFILVALAAIFWPSVTQPREVGFNPDIPFGKKIGLRPGIDMVGGTSLLYEIRPPEGTVASEDLAQTMMASLKRRVDPDGTRNLIWRPQGATRLEIQMPATGGSTDAEAKRVALTAARDALEETNVSPTEVINAVEQTNGKTRADLAALAQGSSARQALFDEMVKAFDAIAAATQARDAAGVAAAELKYEALKARIGTTNVSVGDVNTALSLKADQRAARLAKLRAGEPATGGQATGGAASTQSATQPESSFPARAAAIDAYAKAHDEFEKVRGQLDDAADLKRDLKGAGVLAFHILVHDTDPRYAQMAERLQRQGPRIVAGDEMAWFPVDDPKEYQGPTVMFNDVPHVLAWITQDKSLDARPGREKWGLEKAAIDQNQLGAIVVAFGFDPQGAIYFGDLTRANVGEPMAILLDGKVLSAPNINEPITGGSGQISGGGKGFTRKEADYLVRTLRAGSLPARLAEEPISERTVGPQLGQDNLRRGLIACAFGLAVVAVFLIGYYYLAGVVATFAVLLNMLLILGMMAALQATFTLPGIAGIVLTIGMAVDANVLIFERLREEQVRGLSLRMALRNAYDRAFSAILDGNVTTGITAAILYFVGSEEVKGFGLTLVLGIVSSLFTALFVTKTIFGVMIDRFGVDKLGSLPLTFPKWDQILRPNIDWMGKAWIAYTFSGVFIVIGLIAFGVKWAQGDMLDIEFTKGTSVQFELKNETQIGDVRKLIEEQSAKTPAALPSPGVQTVGTDKKTYEVVTPNDKAAAVREAIIAALGDRLKIELPSKFAGEGLEVDAALSSGIVVPIERADQVIPGLAFTPAKTAAHVGGAAILLKNLDPPISAKEIETRIERQRLSAQGSGEGATYQSFDVEANAPKADAPATEAVLFVSDPAFPYTPGDDLKLNQWKGSLVAPIWGVTNDALTKPAGLQRVTNFDAQVAGETARDALFALFLSIVVIMAYVWIRFGNLKYGTATVVALLHDTLFVLAAVGIAHYIANTFVGDALLIEPFRLNLTLVAAVLTVMGYSMNDTVVVFDRIRENRGKLGHVSRQLINDSINQTLSRTLLTGGTTILTIFVMYISGGAGIHGFTFALLVGILVGTYSSITIASPLLLFGVGREEAGETNRSRAVGQLQRAGA